MTMNAKKSPSRATLYKLLGMAKNQLDIHDDDYRMMQARHGASKVDGKVSAKSMMVWQLVNLLDELKTKGFKIKPKSPNGYGNKADWRSKRLAYIRRLWLLLAESAHEKSVRDSSELAMTAYMKRSCNDLSSVQWITSKQLNQVIESLKSWCERVEIDNADYNAN